jgi:hypothetical protein
MHYKNKIKITITIVFISIFVLFANVVKQNNWPKSFESILIFLKNIGNYNSRILRTTEEEPEVS